MVRALEATGGHEGRAAIRCDTTWWYWCHYAKQYGIREEIKRIRRDLRERFRIPHTA